MTQTFERYEENVATTVRYNTEGINSLENLTQGFVQGILSDHPVLLCEPSITHPAFAEIGDSASGINDARANGTIVPGDTQISHYTLKEKGVTLDTDNPNPQIACARLANRELPYGLELKWAIREYERAEMIRHFCLAKNIPLHFPIALRVNQITKVYGMDIEDFYNEKYLYACRDSLSFLGKSLGEYLLEGDDPVLPAQYSTLIPGYDIRVNQLPSMVAFPQFANYFANDPFFRLDLATGGKVQGSKGGYFGGLYVMQSQMCSIGDVLRKTYGALSKSYGINIELPSQRVTRENYIESLNQIKSQTTAGISIMGAFINNLTQAVGALHNAGYYFCYEHGGGSLITRNVSIGTAERGCINDLVTVHQENDPELARYLQMKDLREMMSTIGAMSRMFSPSIWNGIYNYTVDSYMHRFNGASRRARASEAIRNKGVVEMANFLLLK